MNFSLILFSLVLGTGFFYVLDLMVFRPKRREEALKAVAAARQHSAEIDDKKARIIHTNHMRPPAWLEYTASFFPVILFVFMLRSFVVEPFKIPSGSMIPTLVIGDLILVNKFTYGIRLPIVDKKIIPLNDPKRGDVMVFRYPKDTSLDYIKRVVGLPGDKIEYRNKQLSINGVKQTLTALDKYYDSNTFQYSLQFSEKLDGRVHRILNDQDAPPFVIGMEDFPGREACSYDVTGFQCVVPEGHYFMMGDNRDNSSDSRIWGFVADKQIVGKAFLVWMNFNDLKRIGTFY
jgi:signal peptidase I